MHIHATPTAHPMPLTTRHADLLGFTLDEAALILTAFSMSFITRWQTDTVPTATEIRHELTTALTENPRGEIYEAMSVLLEEDGGPHPDDRAHLNWCRRVVSALMENAVAA
ncbi:hypothetical protein [Streptosporangium subroseum]|uniref:hypothetical protein n=1 Tax=Streptosporangium subroseum TaxID=106412 RepID=UPI00308E887F|nr:hypothetical protein OHB15_47765 [Streptosporangium subroseum]